MSNQNRLGHFIICFVALMLADVPAKDLGVIKPHLIIGGTHGSGPAEFNEPDAVAFSHDGRLLAGDTQNGRFKIFEIEGDSVTTRALGTPGTGPCQFDNSLEVTLASGRKIYNEVQGIVCNTLDEIFVVDQGNRRIQVFDSSGRCLPERTIALDTVLVAPEPESGTTYTSIQGLTIDFANRLYLTDTGTRRVYRFLADGRADSGYEFQLNRNDDYILQDPESMAIYRGKLLVADESHHVIRVFDLETGKFTGTSVGTPEMFSGDVEGLALRGDLLFAMDEAGGRVLIFDLGKDAAPLVGWFGNAGSAPGQFLSADGMAASHDGALLAIADQGNFRIQVFKLEEIVAKLF